MDELEKQLAKMDENCKQIHQLFIERQLVPNEAYLDMIKPLSDTLFTIEDLPREERSPLKDRVLKIFENTKALNGMVAILTIAWDTSASLWDSDSKGIECMCFTQTFAFIQNISWYYESLSCILAEAGMINVLMTSLNAYNPSHFKLETSELDEEIVLMTVATSQNMANCEHARWNFVDSGFVDALVPYLQTPKVYYRTSVIMCLSYLVNESQSEIFKADPSHLRYIVILLERALESEDGTSGGWTAYRLVRGLSTLASNDSNKREILDAGILPSLVTMMKTGDTEDKKVAAHTVWVLSYDSTNKEIMGTNQDVMEALMDLAENSSDKGVKKKAVGALWKCGRYKMKMNSHFHHNHKMGMPSKMDNSRDTSSMVETSPKKLSPSPRPRSSLTKGKPLPPIASPPIRDGVGAPSAPPPPLSGQSAPPPPPISPITTDTPTGHIMISYSWSDQKQVLEISEHIKKAGYKIWLDVDHIEGSTLEAMANAVENAHVVLICMSQAYKDSPNTRAEAEYAFQTKKTIVPVKLQRNYKPDGWLGFIVGSKLFFDFSGKYTFESRIDGLMKELRRKYFPDSGQEDKPTIAPTVGSARRTNQEGGSNSSNNISTWNTEDVRQWLDGLHLSSYDRSVTKDWTGLNLLYLKRIENKAPEFFYHYMATTLKLGLEDMMRLEDGLFII